LNRAFHLGSFVAGYFSNMALGAAHYFVNRALHSVFIHGSTLLKFGCWSSVVHEHRQLGCIEWTMASILLTL
jgi:hypothetical protein